MLEEYTKINVIDKFVTINKHTNNIDAIDELIISLVAFMYAFTALPLICAT